MRKKVKMDIPQNLKINLEELSEEEKLETYTIQIQKIKKLNALNNEPPESSNTNYKSKLTISIISVIVFSLIISTITISIIHNLHPQEQPIKEEKKLSNSLIGSWQSSNNGLFIFSEDNTFLWYNSYQNLNDNYYKGKYNYKTGTDALTEMGFTTDEFKKEYGQDIKLENIYSINLMPTIVLKNKIDTTNKELNENETWWYLLIIRNDNTANGYNKTLDLKYNLIKTAE